MEYQRYVIDLVRTLLVRHANDEDMCVDSRYEKIIDTYQTLALVC